MNPLDMLAWLFLIDNIAIGIAALYFRLRYWPKLKALKARVEKLLVRLESIISDKDIEKVTSGLGEAFGDYRRLKDIIKEVFPWLGK